MWPAADTGAHGGRLAPRTVSGPYRIEAVVSRVAGKLDETITVTDAITGAAVLDTRVVLWLDDNQGQTLGPFVARPTRDGFEARYDRPQDSGWRVRITVQGPLGTVEVLHPAVTFGGEPDRFTATLAGAALILLIPLIAYRFWFRREDAGRPAAGAPFPPNASSPD